MALPSAKITGLAKASNHDGDSKPDVPSIMADIRSRIRADIHGTRDERRPFKPVALSPEANPARDAGAIVHSEELRYLNTHYAYSNRLNLETIKSHRGGFLGRLIVSAKRKISKIIWDSILKDYFEAERGFQSNLVRFLNDVSKYMAARDATMFWELIRKIDVDVGKALERIERISDEQTASLRSTERRVFDALQESLTDLRSRLEVLTESSDRVKTLDSVVRGMEGMIAQMGSAKISTQAAMGLNEKSESLNRPDFSYLLLENRFRGSEADIKSRLNIYPDYFKSARGPVLEIGPGRGELQELFKESGIKSYGIDLDSAMVQASSSKGLKVEQGNGIEHLSQVADKSLGGVIAIQVVEHLNRSELRQLFELCSHKVEPEGTIIFETINPESLRALASNYFRDPTHVWPLHPETLAYMADLSGLNVVETRKLSEIPAGGKLKLLPTEEYLTPRWVDLVNSLNWNIQKLNDWLYGSQDYALICRPR